jgi:mono/diheme cytochrome c family protein
MFNRPLAKLPILFALALTTLATRSAAAQDRASIPSGAYLFKIHCATCHGKDGKGDGPLAAELHFAPADLTLLARRNGGLYPAEQVFRIIDGRKALKGHGGPEMPIWGDAFKGSDEGYGEEKVKQKVDALVEFLKSIQGQTK